MQKKKKNKKLTEILMIHFLINQWIYLKHASRFAPWSSHIYFHAQQMHFFNSPIDVIHLWVLRGRKQGLQSAHISSLHLSIVISSFKHQREQA